MSTKEHSVIFIANRSFALTNSRYSLIQHFQHLGWKVIIATNVGSDIDLLPQQKTTIEPLKIKRGGINLQADWITFKQIKDLYKWYQPTLIHQFHAKPIILGSFASYTTPESKVVSTITGLGFTFANNYILRSLSLIGYRLTLKTNSLTIFQNEADRQLFVQHRLISLEKSALVIGSGVDIQKFHPSDKIQSRITSSKKVLFASRLLKSKGITDYLTVAKYLSTHRQDVIFQVAGEWDEAHPDSIERNLLEDAQTENIIEFLGYVDLAKQLRETDIFVYPSYYAEGLARVLLEAGASGVPIITNNLPGCKEAIIHGKTGFLIEPHNVEQLINTLNYLLDNPELCDVMGQRSRKYISNNFDIHNIKNQYLSLYRSIGIKV